MGVGESIFCSRILSIQNGDVLSMHLPILCIEYSFGHNIYDCQRNNTLVLHQRKIDEIFLTSKREADIQIDID